MNVYNFNKVTVYTRCILYKSPNIRSGHYAPQEVYGALLEVKILKKIPSKEFLFSAAADCKPSTSPKMSLFKNIF